MVQPKRTDRSYDRRECPVCHHPQTKLQRRLTATTNGSTMFVCTRVGQCSIAMNLDKMDTWVAV
jgi:hypothetical protein